MRTRTELAGEAAPARLREPFFMLALSFDMAPFRRWALGGGVAGVRPFFLAMVRLPSVAVEHCEGLFSGGVEVDRAVGDAAVAAAEIPFLFEPAVVVDPL